MQPLFVTGATGLVGKAVLESLIEGGCPVRALVRQAPTAIPGVEWVVGDLEEPLPARALLGSGTVLHLAARTGAANPEQYHRTNVVGTSHLLEAARAAGVTRFVFVSTIAVRFRSLDAYPYARTKREAEGLVQASGLEWVIVRPTLVLGRNAPNLAKLAALAALPIVPLLGGGRARLQPIDVRDLGDLLADVDALPAGQIIEVGGPESLLMSELLGRLRVAGGRGKGLQLSVPLRPLQWGIAVLRTLLGERSPVTVAQLSSFVEDGVAADDPWVAARAAGFRSLEETLACALAR